MCSTPASLKGTVPLTANWERRADATRTDSHFPARAACLHRHAWEWAEHPLREVVQHVLPEIRSRTQSKITLADLLLL